MFDVVFDYLPFLLENLKYFFRSCSDDSCKIDILSQRVRIIDAIVIISAGLEGKRYFVGFYFARGASVDRLAGNHGRKFVGLITDRTEASLQCFVRREIHL
jgi:hypothetical protein